MVLIVMALIVMALPVTVLVIRPPGNPQKLTIKIGRASPVRAKMARQYSQKIHTAKRSMGRTDLAITIETFEYNSDNLGFLLHDNETGATAAIDAGSQDGILQVLQRRNWQLSHILITHYDWDHTDDIPPLKEKFNPRVIGPKKQAGAIRGLDVLVDEGDIIHVGNATLQVIDTSGHTRGHISFFDPDNLNLFCGDTLFSLGCGRMRECDAGTMWHSMEKIRSLPDRTMVYCGHEYSAANARFALALDPDNPALKKRAREITDLIAARRPTIPFNLGQDKAANPFLRASDPELARKMGVKEADPVRVFAAIRKAKDNFA